MIFLIFAVDTHKKRNDDFVAITESLLLFWNMASKFSFAKITKNLATLFEKVTLQYNTIHCIKYELLVPKSNIFCIDLNETNFAISAYNTVVS
jgi:hypothetical protein